MPRDFSEVVFTLTACRISTYNIQTGVQGSPISLPEPQQFSFTPEADTDEIKSSGRLTHLLSVVTHASFSLQGAGVPFAALAIIAGYSNSSSGTTPNRTRTQQAEAGNAGLPYFSVAGRLLGEEGDDLHVGLIACKLDAPPGWSVEQNQYVMQECSGRAIMPDGAKLLYFKGHETATAIDFAELFA